MATLQSALAVVYLIDASLGAWSKLIMSVDIRYIGPLLNQISLVLMQNVANYSRSQVKKVADIMEWLICNHEHHLFEYFPCLSEFPDDENQFLSRVNTVIRRYQSKLTVEGRILELLDSGISHTNALVVANSLKQLKEILANNYEFVFSSTLAEAPIISRLMHELISTCHRFEVNETEIQLLTCECLGSVGIYCVIKQSCKKEPSTLLVCQITILWDENLYIFWILFSHLRINSNLSAALLKNILHLLFEVRKVL